jgi:hypothetical protein
VCVGGLSGLGGWGWGVGGREGVLGKRHHNSPAVAPRYPADAAATASLSSCAR